MSTEEFENDYSIPSEIKERIPKRFYQALFGELVSVLGFSWLIPYKDWYEETEDEPGSKYIEMISYSVHSIDETSGWKTAVVQTCRKLSMDWLLDYAKTLEWYECDIFNYEIADEMLKCFCKTEREPANEYYQYLLETQKKKPESSE